MGLEVHGGTSQGPFLVITVTPIESGTLVQQSRETSANIIMLLID